MFVIPFHLQIRKTSEDCFSAFNRTLGGDTWGLLDMGGIQEVMWSCF